MSSKSPVRGGGGAKERAKGGSRSRSRSRSRSGRARSPRNRSVSQSRSRSRSSRSRSPSRGRERRRHSYSKSPRRNTRQSSAPPGKVLGIFGLSGDTTENDLREEFSRYGTLENCVLIFDKRSGQSKRFGFVYFSREEDATKAKDSLNGITLHGNKVRIDYSYTRKPHSPTPGHYMGKISDSRSGNYRNRYHPYGGGSSYYSRRSPARYNDYDYDRRGRDHYSDRYSDDYDRYDDRSYRRR